MAAYEQPHDLHHRCIQAIVVWFPHAHCFFCGSTQRSERHVREAVAMTVAPATRFRIWTAMDPTPPAPPTINTTGGVPGSRGLSSW